MVGLLVLQARPSPAQEFTSPGAGCHAVFLPDFFANFQSINATQAEDIPLPIWASITLRDRVDLGVHTSNEACIEIFIPLPPYNPFFQYCTPLYLASIHAADGAVISHAGRPLVLGPISGCSPGPAVLPAFVMNGVFDLDPSEVTQLINPGLSVAFWAVTTEGNGIPNSEARGQFLPMDYDGDGVPNYMDFCPHTSAGTVVDGHGCSIEQLCPCGGPWKSHSDYVKHVTRTAAEFRKRRLISESTMHTIVKAAKGSDCGRRTRATHDNDDDSGTEDDK